jgi:hypothetical protein
MSRKRFLSIVERITRTVILVSILGVPGGAGLAKAQQPSIQQIGPGIWAAGIPSNEFEFFAAPQTEGHQRQSNWCWAAAVQMVLNYRGVPVTQEQVVQRIFGGNVPNLPGQPNQILTALSGWAFTANGQPVMLSSSPFAFDGSEIVRDLAERWPIVVGVRTSPSSGHAYVLTAVTYGVDSWNRPIFRSVILRDPWPNNPSRVEVPWDAFRQNWMFMARMRITPR